MAHNKENMQLTEHFRLGEFLVSRDHSELAEKLDPSPLHINNLHLLCAIILEPARIICGVPIHITSGLRSDELNEAVEGSAKSLHRFGKAADIYPDEEKQLGPIFRFIRYDLHFCWRQLIYYKTKGIIHVALPHLGSSQIVDFRD